MKCEVSFFRLIGSTTLESFIKFIPQFRSWNESISLSLLLTATQSPSKKACRLMAVSLLLKRAHKNKEKCCKNLH